MNAHIHNDTQAIFETLETFLPDHEFFEKDEGTVAFKPVYNWTDGITKTRELRIGDRLYRVVVQEIAD